MSKILIIGDPHLGKGLTLGKHGVGLKLNSRLLDQLNLLDWILEKAVELEANHIIITGDVFEEPKPHPTIITLFLSWLKNCSSHDIEVHIISGNHDLLQSGQFTISALDIFLESDFEKIKVYKSIQNIILDNIGITLLPFQNVRSLGFESNSEALSNLTEVIDFYSSEIPDIFKKVLVGHFAIKDSIWIGDEIDDASSEIFLPKDSLKYDYVWMGHIHKPQVLNEKPYVSHIGSMDISDFGETDHKKHIVFIDSDSKEFFQNIELPTRPLKILSIEVPAKTEESTDFVLKEIKEYPSDLSNSIVKLNIFIANPNAPSINRVLVEKALYDKKVFHVHKISEERAVKNIIIKENQETTIDHTISELSAVKFYAERYIKKETQTEFVGLASEIIQEAKASFKD